MGSADAVCPNLIPIDRDRFCNDEVGLMDKV